jgi:hypothetical protein
MTQSITPIATEGAAAQGARTGGREGPVGWLTQTPPPALLEEVLGEADELIRQSLQERALEGSHLVVGAPSNGAVILRSNVSADVLRSFGQDPINVADQLAAPPEPGDTTH